MPETAIDCNNCYICDALQLEMPSILLHSRCFVSVGLAKDENVTRFIKEHNVGGAMIWAANPDPKTNPHGTKLCPQTAAALNPILQPTYAFGAPPNYTKCDASTGLLPTALVEEALARGM